MRTVFALLVLVLAFTPPADAEPIIRRLCDGEPIIDYERCADGVAIYACGSDDRLSGVACFAL